MVLRGLRRTAIAVVGGMAVILGSAASHAATESKLIKTLASSIPHAAFFGISFDADSGVAVGAGGAIAESTDGGATWAYVNHDQTELALLAVDKRGEHAVAVGQLGVVVIKDAGKWTRVDSDFQSRLFSVSVNSAGLAIAVGEFGAVLKSTDGGKSWSSAAPDWSAFADPESFGTGEPNMYSAVIDEAGVMTIAGEYGVILRSSDAGASWAVLRPVKAGVPTLFALHLVPAGQGNSYAVGQTGELLISADGGITWGKCTTDTDSNFLGVTASPDGNVVITGMRVMMRSQNGGMTWDYIEEGDTITDWYQAVRTVPSTGKILAVGHSGKVIQIGG